MTRQLYQQDGVEGLAPLDASLNLPTDRYSFGVRCLVARVVACNSYEHVVAQLGRYSGAQVGKRQVEELAYRAAEDIETFYEERMKTRVEPGADSLLVMSFDGASIRVRPEGLRKATRRRRERRKPKHRRWPAEQGHKGEYRQWHKRRAMVAAVYDVAPFRRTPDDIVRDLRPVQHTDKARRPRPVNKRVWGSVVSDCKAFINDGFTEALRRDPHKTRQWCALVDGDAHQLDCIRRRARELDMGDTLDLGWSIAATNGLLGIVGKLT